MDFYSHAVKQDLSQPKKSSADPLQQRYDALLDQHEKLKRHFASLTETVHALGDQSATLKSKSDQRSDQGAKLREALAAHSNLAKQHSQLQEHFRQAQNAKLDLSQKFTKQQDQIRALKETVEALNNSCEASSEKLLLQKQLHEDKLRTLEAAQRTLKERCTALAASNEQHRLANLKLEERHKSLAKDMQALSLGQEGKSKTERLQALLKTNPIDEAQNARTKTVLGSSVEVLRLAHDGGSTEGMRKCLREVADALHGLGEQLDSQHRLSSAWLGQVKAL
jgi:predicted  nucleic acid-binding Zn-ribbon protein